MDSASAVITYTALEIEPTDCMHNPCSLQCFSILVFVRNSFVWRSIVGNVAAWIGLGHFQANVVFTCV